MRTIRFWLALLLAAAPLQVSQSQTVKPDAQLLAREVVANELSARQHAQLPWMFLHKKDDADKREVSQTINTNEGPVSRLLARDGQPLNEAQESREKQRIQELLRDPGQQEENRRKYQHDVQKALDMLKVLPDAFLFHFDGEEGHYVRLRFEPNPNYRPGSLASRVSHAMHGTMVVDPAEKRLVDLNGVLGEDVKFWAGILGSVKKGGTYRFRQDEMAPGQWVATQIDVNINGRFLLFRGIHKQQHWTFSNFQQVPRDITLAQAGELLVRMPATLPQESGIAQHDSARDHE